MTGTKEQSAQLLLHSSVCNNPVDVRITILSVGVYIHNRPLALFALILCQFYQIFGDNLL